MVGVSKHWSRRGQLLLLAISAFVGVHLAYEYWTAAGQGETYIAVIGLSVLLIALFAALAQFDNIQMVDR